jgi:L-ascorbate metabolism protein UlaG (beta-lactamase superfamily)
MLRRLLSVTALMLLMAAAWLGWQLYSRPSLEPFAALWMGPAPPAAAGELRVTFLGVSTLLFDDGETAIMTDGFFSRPELHQVLLGKVGPNREVIAAALQRAGVHQLAAVAVLHSHYDHAMDAPEVARLSGALLMGSSSTANVARGWGLQPARMREVKAGETVRVGRFELEWMASAHAPTGFTGGVITQPLVPPARAWAYKEGESYSLLLRHGGRSVLVQASAGYRPGALAGRQADVVFLGVGGLGKLPPDYIARYWGETVQAVHARRVIPVHWDDFTRPLTEPLRASPRLFDGLDVSMAWMGQAAAAQKVDLRLAPVWQRIDPFAGL